LGLFFLRHDPQGSSFLATLGFEPESLWDSSQQFPKGIKISFRAGLQRDEESVKALRIIRRVGVGKSREIRLNQLRIKALPGSKV
jgi:hypothetical protein